MSSTLLFRAADNTQPDSLASRLRRRRFQTFATLARTIPEPVRILDIGGSAAFWRMHLPELRCRAEITVVNLEHRGDELQNVIAIKGDARDLSQFGDRSFDLGFSNSLLEHVGSAADQRRLAQEIRRVCRGYFVQTPNRYFPIEPHFLVPGWQFLPIALRTSLVQQRQLGWMQREMNRSAARTIVESIRLLNAREMRALFPDARLIRERIGGLTKSLIAVRALA